MRREDYGIDASLHVMMARRAALTRIVSHHLAVKSTTTSLVPAPAKEDWKCASSLIFVTGIVCARICVCPYSYLKCLQLLLLFKPTTPAKVLSE